MSPDHSKNHIVIVAAIDQTAASEPVIFTATSFASCLAGELHLVHVVEEPTVVGGGYVSPAPDLLADARPFVDRITNEVKARYQGKVVAHLGVGTPYKQILQLASDLEADLVVVGSHGRNAVERFVTGSVSRAVVRHARCAVLVARPKAYETVPAIEPACPRCLEVQHATRGEELWCEQHATPHAHGRLHYETPQSYGVGSMFIRP